MDQRNVELLCGAAELGDLETIASLLDGEPVLVQGRHEGATALHFAALGGQNAAATLLLDRGADPNVEDTEFGSPPAGWANEKGHQQTVQLLVDRGAQPSPCQAAAWGCLDQLERLLRESPQALNQIGFGSPLHEAAAWGRTEIVARLLELGADAHAKNRDGLTALDLARAQAANGRAHSPIVGEMRKRAIEQECARIVILLQTALHPATSFH